jgi:hypothetical protein
MMRTSSGAAQILGIAETIGLQSTGRFNPFGVVKCDLLYPGFTWGYSCSIPSGLQTSFDRRPCFTGGCSIRSGLGTVFRWHCAFDVQSLLGWEGISADTSGSTGLLRRQVQPVGVRQVNWVIETRGFTGAVIRQFLFSRCTPGSTGLSIPSGLETSFDRRPCFVAVSMFNPLGIGNSVSMVLGV